MKTYGVRLITAVLLGMAIAGCAPRETTLPEQVITALQSRFNENDPDGAAALFADDGEIMPKFGEPIRGRDEIRKYLAHRLDRNLQFWIRSEANKVSGHIAYDLGSVRTRDTASGRDVAHGHYITIFHKIDGQWKIHRSINNANSPEDCASVHVDAETPTGNSTE
jgi:uncharacterized protein (TIGR02246 family)